MWPPAIFWAGHGPPYIAPPYVVNRPIDLVKSSERYVSKKFKLTSTI